MLRTDLILDVVEGIGPEVHTHDYVNTFIFSNYSDLIMFVQMNPDLVNRYGEFGDSAPVLFITKDDAKRLNITHGTSGYDPRTDYGDKRATAKSLERLKHHLNLPLPTHEDTCGALGTFDPWEIFPCFYGTYSGAFDKMAISVLEKIRDGKPSTGEGLAEEMFREYLCRSHVADYGTSPRVCFVRYEFKEVFPTLIEKWRGYARVKWGEWGAEMWPELQE